MFIGHDALAFASKGVARRTSLGTLVMAATWLDLIWPLFLVLGIEHVRVRGGSDPFLVLDFYDYPWSHSLVMSVAWSVAFAVVYWCVTRYGRGAVITGLLVFSHWALDFVTHIPDLPITPAGTTKVGLGLWNSVAGTIVIEVLMYAIGIWIYVRTMRARDRIGSIALIAFVVFLLLIYAANFGSGPPPNNSRVIGYVGLASWLLPVWAWWIDRHRESVPA